MKADVEAAHVAAGGAKPGPDARRWQWKPCGASVPTSPGQSARRPIGMANLLSVFLFTENIAHRSLPKRGIIVVSTA